MTPAEGEFRKATLTDNETNREIVLLLQIVQHLVWLIVDEESSVGDSVAIDCSQHVPAQSISQFPQTSQNVTRRKVHLIE